MDETGAQSLSPEIGQSGGLGEGGVPAAIGAKPGEPDENERALVAKWEKRIGQALKDAESTHKEYERRRKRIRGVKSETGIKNEDRTNLIFATIAAIMPMVYAKNPDISVAPSEAVSQDRYGAIKAFSDTLQIVLSRVFVQDAFLKKRAKAAVRSAMTTSLGWVKLTYQKDVRKDPLILNRMNDIQDNIQRLQALIARSDDPERAGSVEADKAELEQALKGLEGQVEKVISEGLVLDNVLSEDLLILDDTVRSFDGYEQSSALAHRVWYTEERFEATFGRKPEGATVFSSTKAGDTNADSTKGKLYAVWEIWHHNDNQVLTLCRGMKGWVREPYQPEKLGAHWYPFFPLGFNVIDGQFQPMSDVELLEKLADEYNDTREQLFDHRKDSRPVRVLREGGSLTPEDVAKIQKRESGEIVTITGAGGKPLRDDMEEFPAVTLNPAVYDTSPIRSDMDVVSGATDAARGTVAKAKTATEAEYLQQGLAGRTGERQDAIADWIADMARYAAEILLQEMTPQQVQRIAGDAATWPTLTKDDVLDLVQIQISASSMGRPNKMREQEQWTKLLPVLQNGIQQIVMMRAQGMPEVADSIVELLRETLRRFDERIDIDKLIPAAPAMGAGVPVLPGQPPAGMPVPAGGQQPGATANGMVH